eukprot:5325024-Pyramimonas_sp.AAC.1
MVAVEDRNALVNGILESCAGMLQGAKGDPNMIASLLPYSVSIYSYLREVRRARLLRCTPRRSYLGRIDSA